MNGEDFTTEELLKGLHDRPNHDFQYQEMYLQYGKPALEWKNKDGRHFVYRKDGTETHYVVTTDKSGNQEPKIVSQTAKDGTITSYDTPGVYSTRRVTTPDGKSKRTMRGASQYEKDQAKREKDWERFTNPSASTPAPASSGRYQVPASRQAQVASAQPAAPAATTTGGEAGGKKGHPFHGNQFTSHGTDVPVQGPQPKAKSLDFSTETLLAESRSNKPQ